MHPQFKIVIVNYPGAGCIVKNADRAEFNILRDFETPDLETPFGKLPIVETYFFTERSPIETIFFAIVKLGVIPPAIVHQSKINS